MLEFDAGSIVPSTRDLLQVITTKKRSLALIAAVGPDRPAEDAARLHDLNVSALAFAEPGPPMQLGAGATKTVPSLCLLPAPDRDACLRARFHGADGVCIDAAMPLDEWDKVAKHARSMRMLPLALVADAAGAEAAVKAGARAIVIRAASSDEVLTIAKTVPKPLTVVAEIADADAGALRALVGSVDAAVVPAALHGAPGFADLIAEVDP
jgi:hypothetical protein